MRGQEQGASDPSAVAVARSTRPWRGLGFREHPAGLHTLFMTELWERFSYYGMRALLVLYMTAPLMQGGLAWSAADAGRIYGNYTMAIYLLAIPGGFIADGYLGARRAVLIGGTMIACGHFCLAVATTVTFFLGLALIALGTGLFKPSISALVGSLYAQRDDRRDAGFSIFYMGINIGAFFAPLVTGFLAQSAEFKGFLAARGFDPAMSWHWGFAAAGVGMVLALVHFCWRNNQATVDGGAADEPATPPAEGRSTEAGWVAAGSIALFGLVVLADVPQLQWLRAIFVLAPLAAIFWFARADDLETRRLAAVFVFFIASMLFWAVFDQAATSIALFADQLTRNEISGWAFPSAWYQALNPLFVIALAPVFAGLWVRMGERQPSAAAKFALGLVFLTASLLLMIPAAKLAMAGKVSPLWLVALFFLQTLGELCVSPVGLSLMTKLAPPGRAAIMLGIWFLAAAWGSKLAGIMGSQFDGDRPERLAQFFLEQAVVIGVATIMLAALVPWLKRLLAGRE